MRLIERAEYSPHRRLPVSGKAAGAAGVDRREFAARSTLIGSVTYDQIKNAGDSLTYTDNLELAGEPARLRYAVRYVNAAGQRAAFSNFLLLEPAARIAKPPTLIATGKEISEDAVTISWEPPIENIDGSTPVNLLGYNVYRVAETESEVNPAPHQHRAYYRQQVHRSKFQVWGNLSLPGAFRVAWHRRWQVESLNSNSITVSPKDVFAPSAPRQ